MKLTISQDKNNSADLCGHMEDFLSDSEIDSFYSYQTKPFKPAGTRYRGLDKSVRDCDKLGGATVPTWLRIKLGRAISFYNDVSYKFDLYPMDSTEHEFNIVRYKKKGQFFKPHRDCRPYLEHILERKSMRKISISVQLSDESEYGGGNLEIAESFTQRDLLSHSDNLPKNNFRHRFKTMKKKGSLTIFTSFHLHESTPLLWGSRDVLVCFIHGESKVW